MKYMKFNYGLAMMLAMLESPVVNEKSNLRISDIVINKIDPPKPKGLKRFVINGKEIWAINEKNAIRKANKLN